MSTTTLDEKVAAALKAGDITEYEAKNPQTVPTLWVERAAKSTIRDMADLLALSAGDEMPSAPEDTDARMEALGISPALCAEDRDVIEEAEERLDTWPLAVEATTTFEVVLGTGGPDTRLMIQCDRIADETHAARMQGGFVYEVRRVFYRYSWSGSADFELRGVEREAVEAFARRVVPELADA